VERYGVSAQKVPHRILPAPPLVGGELWLPRLHAEAIQPFS
jgi:hypothetical protein